MSNVRTQIGKVIGKSLNSYHSRVKPKIDELKFKEQYQGRIIDCMVGEVDDNYIETPETDEKVVKLEHSKDGVVKIARIKGKTILVDEEGNETDTPGEGCRLVSVGEEEDNKLIILSKNKNLFTSEVIDALCNLENWVGNGAYRNNYVAYNLMNFKNGVTYTNTIPSIKIPPNFYPILYLENVGNGHFLASGLYNNNTSNEMTAPLRKWTFSPQNVGSFRAHVNSWNDENMQKLRKVLEQNIQTEVGNIGTDYIKAMCHKTEILLKEPLREGDYIEGKKIYRNVKQDGLTLIPLEEPIIEELPNSITLQGFDDTTMYIENSITPTVQYGYNALIPYKQELLNQKEEVETNTLDIEQNIIPYLMDMEFNLMLMEDNE